MDINPDKVSILIVDDTPDNLTLLADILIGASYDVRQANNGELAIKTATANPPGLILLDIKMPGMDGYEVCHRLKNQDDTKGIPVIFLTALDDSADKIRAFSVGGVDYITKPFDSEEVLARVETHLKIRFHRNGLEREVRTLREGELATGEKAPQGQGSDINLTAREKECLIWLSRGLRNDRIGERLDISPLTVEFHLANVRRKLSAATREQALAIAIKLKLVQL